MLEFEEIGPWQLHVVKGQGELLGVISRDPQRNVVFFPAQEDCVLTPEDLVEIASGAFQCRADWSRG